MSALYGILIGIPDQRAIVESHCWGPRCGKGIGGAIVDEHLGEMLPCRTPAAECPCFEREMDEPFGAVQDEPLYIRKLREELP